MALRLYDSSFKEDFRPRFAHATIVLLTIFTLLLGRVWYLQIYNGRQWRQFAEQNRLDVKRLRARRGKILDRNGNVIADSRPSFNLLVTPFQIKEEKGVALDRVARLLAWERFPRAHVLKKIQSGNQHDAVVVRRDMNWDELALFKVRQYAFHGFSVIDTPARFYPNGAQGSHLLGYLGEISRNDLAQMKKLEDPPYRYGDVWGISGVEKRFEESLKGQDGSVPVVKNVWGRELGEESSQDLLPAFHSRDPEPGNDLVLSIDLRLQEVIEEAFTHPAGAVVALDPRNGDVLALVSRPEYYPERFVGGVSSNYWKELNQDSLNPLYDRALRGIYPPASAFKLITGVAALQEEVTDTKEEIFCPGYYRIGREIKRCWRHGGHGWVDFHKAVSRSCDVYFYEMGKRLGVDKIAEYAQMFGLGRPTGIGINRESKGLVPTEAWKQKTYGEPWVGGETLSVAIGQGALQTTPIQMAVAVSMFANQGMPVVPRIALRTQSPYGELVEEFPIGEAKTQVELRPEVWEAVRQGMVGVVNDVGATAYWTGRSKFVRIAGKTGTAQVVGRHAEKRIEDHAWFVAYAPEEDPQIAVSVIVENGGGGSKTAAPIAKKVIEAFFRQDSI